MIEDVLEIGVVDARNIMKVLHDAYGCDLSGFMLTSLKFRIEKYMHNLNGIPVDMFVKRLLSDSAFFESFLHAVSIGSGSMFQDPSLWRYLRDVLLPRYIKEENSCRVWFPRCIRGNELFSMAILLKENAMLTQVSLFASCLSEKSRQLICSGFFDEKSAEQNEQNYARYNPSGDFKLYVQQTDKKQIRDVALLEQVSFDRQAVSLENAPGMMDLIVFRNQTLNYTPAFKNLVIENLSKHLIPGGFLVLGNKENLNHCRVEKDFLLVSDSESLYKKK